MNTRRPCKWRRNRTMLNRRLDEESIAYGVSQRTHENSHMQMQQYCHLIPTKSTLPLRCKTAEQLHSIKPQHYLGKTGGAQRLQCRCWLAISPHARARLCPSLQHRPWPQHLRRILPTAARTGSRAFVVATVSTATLMYTHNCVKTEWNKQNQV